jgi:hypothetical protein
MARIRHRDFSKGLWLAGGRDTIPRGTLFQAKGVRAFTTPQARSRFGSELAIAKANVHSLFSFNGTRYCSTRFGDFNSSVLGGTATSTIKTGLGGHRLRFAKGIPTVDIDNTKFPLGPEHMFVVGGGLTLQENEASSFTLGVSNMFKVSTTESISNVGIFPPLTKPIAHNSFFATARSLTNSGQILDTFDLGSAGWLAITTPPFTAPVLNVTSLAQHGSAMFFGMAEDTVSSIGKTFSPNKNLQDVSDGVGNGRLVSSSDQDWIQLFVFCDQPANLDFLEILLVSQQATRATFSFQILVEDSVFASSGITGIGDDPAFFQPPPESSPEKQRKQLNDLAKQKEKLVKKLIPIQAEKILNNNLGSTRMAKTSFTWTLLRIPKESFTKVGNPTWGNINGAEITAKTNANGPVQLIFDDWGLHLGVGMLGGYKYAYTYKNSKTGTRSNPAIGQLAEIDFDVVGVQRDPVVLSNLTPSPDPQVDTIEIWRNVGNGSAYFKTDEFANNIPGLATLGYTDVIADFPGVQKSFAQAFDLRGLVAGETRYIQDEELPLDNAQFPQSMKDIAGPHFNRMFFIDGKVFTVANRVGGGRGRLYFSAIGRLESNEGFIDVTTDDDPLQRVIIWANNLYCFSREHLYEIQGSDIFISVEVTGVLGTVKPDTVVATPFGLIYQAIDGIRIFDGAGSQLVFPEPILPLLRGETNLDPTASARQFIGLTACYKDEEYIISDFTDTLAINLRTGTWRNLGVGANALYVEPADVIQGVSYPTRLFLATLTNVLNFEVPGTFLDAGAAIPFLIEVPGTKIEDQSSTTKIVQRIYLDMKGGPVTVKLHYTAPTIPGVQTIATANTAARQLIEYGLALPSDVISVEISGNLIQPFELYEVGFDVHLPEEGGALT